MNNLNLHELANQLDDTFAVWLYQDGRIEVERNYNQRLLRNATNWEPEEYTEETSESITVKAEGEIVIFYNGSIELTREDFGEMYEDSHASLLEEILDSIIPWRDLQKEADEAYGEWLIDRYEDQLYEREYA